LSTLGDRPLTARAVRSLENLENTASTARVLNLRAIALRYRDDKDYLPGPCSAIPA
jgi:hypothetical protein